MSKLIFKQESFEIIGACMEVHNQLGPGFLESVYQQALHIELCLRNIPHQMQVELPVYYKTELLPKGFRIDFLCYDEILLEIKALKDLTNIERAIALNYLKVSRLPLCHLVNFGEESLAFERYIYSKNLDWRS